MVALFGSYAGGDYSKDSDIDVLVVSKSHDYALRKKIVELTDRAMEAVGYKEMLSPILMDLRHFNKIKNVNTDLYYFLNRDGAVLWQTKA